MRTAIALALFAATVFCAVAVFTGHDVFAAPLGVLGVLSALHVRATRRAQTGKEPRP